MEFRLSGDDLESLYAHANAQALSAPAIYSFFALLEAIESAASLDDLGALRSLGMMQAGKRLAFTLEDGFIARAALVLDGSGDRVISFVALPGRL